jgi:thiol-disulfide isomerase/thioredoxin
MKTLATIYFLITITCAFAQSATGQKGSVGAIDILSKVEGAIGKIKTLSYTSQTKAINSGRKDSVEIYTAKCWVKREPSDTIFRAHLHLQVAANKGRADYYYDGINGIDIWHEHKDKALDKTITVITPKDLPSGINDVQARMSLIPYVPQLIDSTINKWKLSADSMKVTELSNSWVLQWNADQPRAGVSTLFKLVIDKRSFLISEWHQFTTWNGVRFFTSQLVKDIKVNDAADEEYVYLKTTYPSYTTIHFRDEKAESKDAFSLLNTVLPEFSYKSFSGKSVSSAPQKLMLLDFWETWCGYCLVAMPKIKSLHEKYKSKGLEVVGIVTENKTQVEKLLKTQQTPYETIFADKAYLQKLGVVGRPRYLLVNENGVIIADSEGSLEEIEKLIAKLLGS